jgi:hypothetical protein
MFLNARMAHLKAIQDNQVEEPKSIVRLPQCEMLEMRQPERSYKCLEDLLNELIKDQRPAALSRW